MQSSPSPTSIITSINQSNYLCNTSNTQLTTQKATPKDNTGLFERPKTSSSLHDTKQRRIKRVVIVQKEQSATIKQQPVLIDTQHTHRKNYVINGQIDDVYKLPTVANLQRSEKQGNYELKNLIINNYVQDFSNSQNMYSNQPNPHIYNQTMKLNNYAYVRPRFYLPNHYVDNSEVHDGNQIYVIKTMNQETALDCKVKSNKDTNKTDESADQRSMTINSDGYPERNNENDQTGEFDNNKDQ